ncbi:MAG: hypothetical protein E6I53_03270 [Chloroflexi bacterium]|nr:MAG: hypothetical protein E6I53_03270 [Chloroflexota bacterium]
MDLSFLKDLYAELGRIEGYLYTIVHPNLILAKVLQDSVGLLLNVWFKFILTTTDFETGGDFVNNMTIQRFEPKVQLVADAALVLIALWPPTESCGATGSSPSTRRASFCRASSWRRC